MRKSLVVCFALASFSTPPDSLAAGPGPGRQVRPAPSRLAPLHPQATRHPYPFYRGAPLPAQYRHRSFVVDNWRVHRLPPPPRGHHWVEIGADYLLVAIATGVIVQVLATQAAAAAPAPPPPPGAVYYFCQSANAYYPYVTQCPEGWTAVPGSPPGPVR